MKHNERNDMTPDPAPEQKIRDVVDACADCDVCRHLMDANCLFFPELYRLWDREKASGKRIAERDLRGLVDLCNFCALCPCPNIRGDIMAAKTAFIRRDGLPLSIRFLEDVEQVGRICGALPRLANRALQHPKTGRALKQAAGIHADRRLPVFPEENFPTQARKRRLHLPSDTPRGRKVAYFAGCTGRYLFPDVPAAAADALQANGVDVYYPEQQCCGMPTMLEGDQARTVRFARFNAQRLAGAVEQGHDIVCSCPTCAYMFRTVLREGAYYSAQYQARVGGDDDAIRIPATYAKTGRREGDFVLLKKSIYKDILKDEGYFSDIDPLQRIKVAENTYDLGEYLLNLHEAGELKTGFGPAPGRVAYFPPCHLREQKIGRPFATLMGRIPELTLEEIGGSFYCCGMAGIMGFKKEFHEASVHMGSRLADKIGRMHPELIVTECLSCRLQFNQMTPYEVRHPVEILNQSWTAG